MIPAYFQCQLLGGLRLVCGDRPVLGVNTPRLQSLLAFLVLSAGTPQLRQHVAFSLWPDTTEPHARNSLRQLLHQLRQALPEADRFLGGDGNTIYWQKDERQSVDVWMFEHALSQADESERRGDAAGVRDALEKAVEQYQGDLLPACYDEWIAAAREDLQKRYRRACARLVPLLEQAGDYGAATGVAEGMLRSDPLDEEAYARLMRLQALAGDIAAVRRTYRAAVDTYRRELGSEPDAALQELYERLAAAPLPGAAVKDRAGARAGVRAGPPAGEPSAHGPARTAGGPSLALVGRKVEWQKLQAAWRQAASGEAHLVLIGGEAGIGKSRLAEELFTRVMQEGHAAAHARSYGAEGRLSLSAITEWLRSPELRAHWAGLDRVWLTEVARLLPELLADRPGLPAPQPIAEAGGRQRFFEALARAVLAAPPPLLLLIDDMQWCDGETLEWLHFLLRFARGGRLLILGTARSEESTADHPLARLDRQLRSEGRITRIDLSPLDAAETARLAAQVTGSELDDLAATRLYRETEGNPLFVVETARSGMIGGRAGSPPAATAEVPGAAAAGDLRALPPRVHAVIAERLAQLSPLARRIAEIGSVVGRAFSLEVLLQAAKEDEEEAVKALDELWQRRVIREQNPGEFDFTHDKLREVAFSEISPPQRRVYHRRIAQALEALNAQDLDPVSSQIAAQYEQAGMIEQAIPYYQKAGAVARALYDNDEAIAILTHALALLAQLPPGPRRDAQELALQAALAPPYRITKGWTSREVEAALNRALALSDRAGDTGQRAVALYGLQSLQVVAGRLEKVEYTYAEMRELFERIQGQSPPPFAGLMYTGAKFHMGRIAEAREQFEQILAVRNPQYISDLQDSQGVNYLVLGRAWNAQALWCLGYPEQALQSALAAVAFAREYGQPFNQALAVTYLAMLREMRAGGDGFLAHAEEALALTHEYQAPYYHAWASILVHFARGWLDPGNDAAQRLADAIAAFRESGARLRLPYFLSLLARLYGKIDEPEQGLAVIEQASAESFQNHERWWDAELHRVRGELMLAQGADPGDVEAAFRRAIDIARRQRARSLELRAAISLACLCRQDAGGGDARQVLAAAHGWFTEGLETADLKEAKALLDG